MHAYVYVCACMCVSSECMCICMYMYICMSVYMYAYTYIIRARVGVHMHSCRHILFICTVQSLYYMRVYHRCFLTLACVCVGGLEVGFVSAFSWLAPVTGVGGYVLTLSQLRGALMYKSGICCGQVKRL